MAAPTYATDLAPITLCDSGTFTEFTGWTAGTLQTVPETDYYIQNSGSGGCVSSTCKTTQNSIAFNYGSGITVPTDGAVLFWQVCWVPNSMGTFDNGGQRCVIGSGIGDFKMWKSGGSDYSPNPYGGWKNVAIDPTVTQDYSAGTPTSTLQYFGIALLLPTSYPSKGAMFGMDAIRYGRGELRVSNGSSGDGYATFAGMAAANDSIAARWGLFQSSGAGYLWKGLITLGYSTAVEFIDSNISILIDDTPRVGANFNKIEVKQSGSVVTWNSISIQAGGTTSRGRFEAVDNADINLYGCTFTDMDTFVFQSGSTIEDTVFRRCGQLTQGSAVFDGCLITNCHAAVSILCNNPNNIDNCEFVSDGSNHALQLTSACAGNSYTLTNVTFTDYASSDGSSGNEAIYNDSGGAVTITISGGNTPSVRNGSGASTTIVSGAVTVKAIVQTATGTKIAIARVLLAVASGGPFPYQASVTIANSSTTATVTHTGHGLLTNDKVLIEGASHVQNIGVFTITKINDDSYSYTMSSAPGSDPTGTITATFVFLSGLTDGSGEISISRVVSSDQPVSGWARKASDYYKTGYISGTVDSADNTTFTAILALDL